MTEEQHSSQEAGLSAGMSKLTVTKVRSVLYVTTTPCFIKNNVLFDLCIISLPNCGHSLIKIAQFKRKKMYFLSLLKTFAHTLDNLCKQLFNIKSKNGIENTA